MQIAANDRSQLVLENIAHRRQLADYRRSVGRPNITDRDRIFWLTVTRMLREWRVAPVIVQPATVIKWHRNGFRHYWRWKSGSKPGRPPIAMAVIMLSRRMSIESVTWDSPRIKDELSLPGHEVAISTVAKYMVPGRNSEPDQSLRTFLADHMSETAACDFFVVPTVTLQRLFCFVVMSLDRRRILHVNVIKVPTAEWVGAADRRSVAGRRVGASLPAAGQGWRVRVGVQAQAQGARHHRARLGVTFTLPERIRPTRDRQHPPRGHGSHHPDGGGALAADRA